MDRKDWDRKYAEKELVWSAGPNGFLVEEVSSLRPGTAADLAAGEGRNAIWLAQQGWQVTAVDYSPVAIDKGRRIARRLGVEVGWVTADLLDLDLGAGRFDLVALFYLQLPWEEMAEVLQRASRAVAPAGTLLLVGHDLTNLDGGHGGPQDPGVLYTPGQVAAELTTLRVKEAARRRRDVETDQGVATAIDCFVRAVAERA